MNCITERLHFAQYILSNGSNDKTISHELLCSFWDIIVETALIKNEGDVLYKWLKDVVEAKGSPISNEDLTNFFKNKLTTTSFCKNISIEGFNCFKLVFLLINERLEKLIKYSTSAVSLINTISLCLIIINSQHLKLQHMQLQVMVMDRLLYHIHTIIIIIITITMIR